MSVRQQVLSTEERLETLRQLVHRVQQQWRSIASSQAHQALYGYRHAIRHNLTLAGHVLQQPLLPRDAGPG